MVPKSPRAYHEAIMATIGRLQAQEPGAVDEVEYLLPGGETATFSMTPETDARPDESGAAAAESTAESGLTAFDSLVGDEEEKKKKNKKKKLTASEEESVAKAIKRCAAGGTRLASMICRETERGVLGTTLGDAAGKLEGGPMNIEMKAENKDFKPCHVTTARQVPIHFKEPAAKLVSELVKSKVMRRELGPTEWCLPAHFVPKPNASRDQETSSRYGQIVQSRSSSSRAGWQR